VLIRAVVVILVMLTLARLQSPIEQAERYTEGIDIVLALDCSTSMLAEDFKVGGQRMNRLDVIKDVVDDFINDRPNDRIAMVAFAARAYTVCPLTLDHSWLLKNLERVRIGMIEDGTAVGSAIATSLNRLKDSQTKEKIVIELTDGRNNVGDISPVTAAEAAKALGIKVYTIGAGSKGVVPYPVKDFFGNKTYQGIEIDLDEDTLMKIASETDAKYFRATDTESLKNIYKEIDKMEKTPMKEKGYVEYKELFPIFLIPAIFLLFIEIILDNTIFRKIP